MAADRACNFKVCLNPAVTDGLTPDELKALQLEFADWFPGPDLLKAGTEVRLIPKHDRGYRNLVGSVSEHLASDPRLVQVTLPGDGEWSEETVRVLYSIVRPLSKSIAEEILEKTDLTVHGLVDRLKWIGYNEFECGGRTEREFWSRLDGEGLRQLRAGQMLHRAGQDSDTLLVMHVRYSEPSPADSGLGQAEWIAVRATRSLELRAHQVM
jgi:hypothetical protein